MNPLSCSRGRSLPKYQSAALTKNTTQKEIEKDRSQRHKTKELRNKEKTKERKEIAKRQNEICRFRDHFIERTKPSPRDDFNIIMFFFPRRLR